MRRRSRRVEAGLAAVLLLLASGSLVGGARAQNAPEPKPQTAPAASAELPDAPLAQTPQCRSQACCPADAVMSCDPKFSAFAAALRSLPPRPLTPKDKLRLAGRNVIDPFNLLTIVATSAITIGSDSHSAYGPGMAGFGKNVGVSFSQDVTGEFFGTFLIPSLVGQDPHYHRMPHATIKRRLAHTVTQVVWTRSDTGHPMFNYASVFTPVIADVISNAYVPGRNGSASATTARVATALATDPADNIITEFLPDIARHISFRVVFVQRIINRVHLEASE